jgi:hypothetical protein
LLVAGQFIVRLEQNPEQRRCRTGGQAGRFVRQDHADGFVVLWRSPRRVAPA